MYDSVTHPESRIFEIPLIYGSEIFKIFSGLLSAEAEFQGKSTDLDYCKPILWEKMYWSPVNASEIIDIRSS